MIKCQKLKWKSWIYEKAEFIKKKKKSLIHEKRYTRDCGFKNSPL